MQLWIVDAFTDRAFAGNPAGVVRLPAPAEPDWMQSVAAELGFAETAFVEEADDEGRHPLRWFTPTAEVDLCGHATLATAHVLGGDRTFITRSGDLRAEAGPDGAVTLDFPLDSPRDDAFDLGPALPGAHVEQVARGRDDLLVRLPDEAAVRAVTPERAAVLALGVRGLIVTGPADDPAVDFVSRFFAPAVGVDEDPVTGSAHCLLAPFWGQRLGKTELVGHQVSARGGVVRVRIEGERVRLVGHAVTVVVGELVA